VRDPCSRDDDFDSSTVFADVERTRKKPKKRTSVRPRGRSLRRRTRRGAKEEVAAQEEEEEEEVVVVVVVAEEEEGEEEATAVVVRTTTRDGQEGFQAEDPMENSEHRW